MSVDAAPSDGRGTDLLEGFGESYGLHRVRVHAAARRMCGPVDAEDVAQEVFLRLWEHPGIFDAGRGSLPVYLQMQARARAVDKLRSETARRGRELGAVRGGRGSVDAVEESALARCIQDRVRDALARIPEGARDAIWLAYFAGYSYREVGRRLGVPEGTIKSRIRSGLAQLRALLPDLEPGPEPGRLGDDQRRGGVGGRQQTDTGQQGDAFGDEHDERDLGAQEMHAGRG